MRELVSEQVGNNTLTYYLPYEKFYSFQIIYSGVANTGQTVNRKDLGSIILNGNSEDLINTDASILTSIDNLYGGVPSFSSVAASNYTASVFIRAGLFWDSQNIYYPNPNYQTFFKLDFSDLAAKSVSGTVTILGKNGTGVQRYVNTILSRSVVASGAGTLTNVINYPNIASIYLKNSQVLDNIQISSDNRKITDGSQEAAFHYSNWFHRIETALTVESNDIIGIEINDNGNLNSYNSNQLDYKYNFNTGATLQQYYSAVRRTPNQELLSRQRG